MFQWVLWIGFKMVQVCSGKFSSLMGPIQNPGGKSKPMSFCHPSLGIRKFGPRPAWLVHKEVNSGWPSHGPSGFVSNCLALDGIGWYWVVLVCIGPVLLYSYFVVNRRGGHIAPMRPNTVAVKEHKRTMVGLHQYTMIWVQHVYRHRCNVRVFSQLHCFTFIEPLRCVGSLHPFLLNCPSQQVKICQNHILASANTCTC